MGQKKYTDEEIIKALECCVNGKSIVEVCSRCPFFLDGNCTDLLKQNALALINRQKAEIEKLTTERDEARRDCAVAEHNHQLAVAEREANVRGFAETLQKIAAEQASRVVEAMDEIKVVAIKEFAQRLVAIYENDKTYDRPNAHTLVVTVFRNIDTLVKEMTEELK